MEVGPALDDVCRDLYPRLVGALDLYLRDRGTAEEVAQEALSRLTERWSDRRRSEHPEAWTWRVAFNLATSGLRRRQAERRALARVAAGRAVAPELDTAEALAVREALGRLPDRQRRAVVLRYYADLPLKEIGAVMGCEEGTVKAHLHKAMTTLRTLDLVDPREEP